MTLSPREEGALRLLLLLYPADFRRRHGESLEQSFRDVVEACPGGVFRRGRMWVWLAVESCSAALRVRRDAGRFARNQERGEGTMRGRIFLHELRLAGRALRRNPLFALVAVSTLGLGIGANTAVFGVVNSVLLQPLPYPESDELVWVLNRYHGGGTGAISAPEFWEFRESGPDVGTLSAVTGRVANLTGLGTPLQLQGRAATPGYLAMMGAVPRLGRPFLPDEGSPGRGNVVVVSDRLWRTALSEDPEVLGRSIELNEETYTVVGVLERDYRPLFDLMDASSTTDFWVPLEIDPATFDLQTAERHGLWVVGRLPARDGHDAAAEALVASVRRLERLYPGLSNSGDRDVLVTPLHERVVGDLSGVLLLVSGAVGIVLLLVCVNVANLLMTRAEGRPPEVAIRVAMGGGRPLVALHVMAESLMIALAGGGVGVALAFATREQLYGMLPEQSALSLGATVDWTVIAFGVVISLAAGLLASALPLSRLRKGDIVTVLRAGGRSGTGRGRGRVQRALVVVQVAGAVALTAGGGLMVRTVGQLLTVDPGFDRTDLHVVRINASRMVYDTPEKVGTLYQGIEDELLAVPGVEAAASSWQTPLQSGMSDWPVMPRIGEEPEWLSADPNHVSPSYFDTYRIDVIAGRTFDRSDLDREVGPVVINETAARTLFPDGPAVGRRVNLDFTDPVWREVIGVVGDIRGRALGSEARVQTYTTFAPGPFSNFPSLKVTIRSRLTSEQLRSELVSVLATIDPEVPVGAVFSMDEQVAATMQTERTLSSVLSVFGAMAMLLGAIGVYGMMAYQVQSRRREIGIRLAIGAQRPAVLMRIVRRGFGIGAVGVAIGIVGAIGIGRVLEARLFGVSGTDFGTLALVSTAAMVVIVLASFEPARRAASLDPLETLREE